MGGVAGGGEISLDFLWMGSDICGPFSFVLDGFRALPVLLLNFFGRTGKFELPLNKQLTQNINLL